MEVKPALALPEGLAVTALEVSENVFTLTAVSTQVLPGLPPLWDARCAGA